MIKTTLKTEEIKTEKSFPKLMISKTNNQIVFFTKSGHGIVIDSGDGTLKIGEYSDVWATNYFEDFNEPIILQNE